MFDFCFREVNSGFFYKSATEREKLVQAERQFIDDRVKRIIALKNQVCDGNKNGFIVINQKVRFLLHCFDFFQTDSQVSADKYSKKCLK